MIFKILALVGVWFGMTAPTVQADDLNDGISQYTDENVAGDDSIGSKDTNINFIVVDAIGKAKVVQHQAEKEAEDEAAETGEEGEDQKSRINYNDGKSENNENSIVVEPGSNVEKVINIVIEK